VRWARRFERDNKKGNPEGLPFLLLVGGQVFSFQFSVASFQLPVFSCQCSVFGVVFLQHSGCVEASLGLLEKGNMRAGVSHVQFTKRRGVQSQLASDWVRGGLV
jgi:hypothetical protein